MSECHRTKSLLKGIMIVFKTKGPQIRCIPHGSFGLSQCKSKKHAGWQNLKTWINSKKGPQIRCIPHRRWGLAQCKSTSEEHASSEISFENKTFYALINYRLKFDSERKRTRKTLVLSREANTLPHCKWSCKEQAGFDKNLSIKPYSLISCCFKRNL